MPKRKATGPAESDGEDDDCYSYPTAPVKLPAPFPKLTTAGFSSTPPAFGISTESKTSPFTGNRIQSLGGQLTTSDGAGNGSANSEFSKTLRDLNVSFRSAVRNAVSKNPTYSLVPLVKDYLYHSRVHLENSRKGASPINGINLPPKDFRSLGEFFDDLEKQLTEPLSPAPASPATASSLNTKSIMPGITSGKPVVTSPLSFSTASSSETSIKSAVPALASQPVTSSTVMSSPSLSSPPPPPPKPVVSSPSFFGIRPPSQPSPVPVGTPSSSLSLPSNPTPPVSKPTPFTGFSFFKPPTPSSTPSGLSLTPSTDSAPKPDAKNDDEEADDEDQPPKVEVVQVKEDDAVYSKRCKVFGIVEGKPKDKGIGMLYIKKLESGRYQTVVRADNNLGTVILNILLQKSLPLNKNKNTVTTVDPLANDKKGMPIIIKVKTEDDATELIAKLKEFQQSS